MYDLSERKRELMAQADLERKALALESQRIHQRVHARISEAQDVIRQKRWWILGGALIAGILFARKRR